MNRNLKRRRRSSTEDSEEYNSERIAKPEEKRQRLELQQSSAVSSPILSGSECDVNPSSECDCGRCNVASENTEQLEGVQRLHDLECSEGSDNEVDDSRIGNSECSSRQYGSERVSSPAIIEELSDCDEEFVDVEPENETNTYYSRTVKTAYGQLTPGSSVSKPKSQLPDSYTWSSFRKAAVSNALFGRESSCPVPPLSWASREQFWEIMCRKDEESLLNRNPALFQFQENLRPRMRVILLDWISEVAEVFKMHRETYYLTIDYIDRYLSVVPNIPKNVLQLLGTTCLFLAAKMEEIYPMKIDQFANVTDGACTEEEIFSMEILVLQRLNWLLSPITVNNWLEMMLQFIYQSLGKTGNKSILQPYFSSTLYLRLCKLLDLATLDITSLRFSYGVLAASAIYILVDPNLALSSSGLSQENIEPCVEWMSVYWSVLRDTYSDALSSADLLNSNAVRYTAENRPYIKSHDPNIMKLYDLAQTHFELLAQKEKLESGGPLTPPSSCSKSTID